MLWRVLAKKNQAIMHCVHMVNCMVGYLVISVNLIHMYVYVHTTEFPEIIDSAQNQNVPSPVLN